jgi:hypothetical protein
MTDQTAEHYLRIYRTRLAIAEKLPVPNGRALRLMRALVDELSRMDPSAPVHLEATGPVARFTDATTGRLLAEVALVGDV